MDLPPPASLRWKEGPVDGIVIRALARHCDERGWLAELFRQDEIADDLLPRMAYISETMPGVARGPHVHAEQSDYFVFLGPAAFKLYLWDARTDSPTHLNRQTRVLDATEFYAVIVPPGVIHAYKNLSLVPGWILNAPNRLYRGLGRSQAADETRFEGGEGAGLILD